MTESDVVLGKETPRIYTPPLRELVRGTEAKGFGDRTTDGYSAIEFAEKVLGLALFPWQKWLLIHALELIDDESGGKVYRFRVCLVSVARQNGKTVVATILALWHMFALESRTVIGTAQDLAKADDTWRDAVSMAESCEELEDLFTPEDIFKGHPKCFTTSNGCEYRVAAATRKGGRGFSGDLIIMDELREHSNWESWSSVTNTMNARPEAQAWAFSNAGDATSVVLRYQRAIAHRRLGWPDGEREFDGVLDDMDAEVAEMLKDNDDLNPGWFEWSAPPGAKRNDLEALAQANPSLNHTEVTRGCPTTRTLLTAWASCPAYEYETEVMCRWATLGVGGPFPEGSWEATSDPKAFPSPNRTKVVCVEISATGRKQTYVARAGLKDDGTVVVGIRYDAPGTDWVVEAIVRDKDITDAVVVRTDVGGSTLTLLEELQRQPGLTIMEWKAGDINVAHGWMHDRLRDGTIRHLPHGGLDMAATSAVELFKPGGGWVADIRKSPTDTGPLYATVGALWGLEKLIGEEYDVLESVL